MKAEFTYYADDIEAAVLKVHSYPSANGTRWVAKMDTLYHVCKVTLEDVEEPKGAESA